MNRSEILDKAKEIVTKDRQATHGNVEDNFATIAAMWEAYINAACIAGDNYDLCIAPKDVAVMQIILKIARAASNPLHLDNWLDICGYGACGGEIATNGITEEPKGVVIDVPFDPRELASMVSRYAEEIKVGGSL